MSDAATLANEARCYDCEIPIGMSWAVIAYILQQTIDGEAVSTDPAVLANAARCYDCNGTTMGMIIKSMVDLNASIISGGGGGASCLTFVSTPPVLPPDPVKCPVGLAIGYGDLFGFYYVYDPTVGAWLQQPGGP